LETKNTMKKKQNLKNGKVRFRLNIDVRKEKEDSWLNVTKTLLDNWLKNEHITVDIIYYLPSLLVSEFFYEF